MESNTLPALALGLPEKGRGEGGAIDRGNLLASRRRCRNGGGEMHVRRRRKAARVAVRVVPVRLFCRGGYFFGKGEDDESAFSGEEQIDRDGRMKDVGEKDTEDRYQEQATDVKKRAAIDLLQWRQ